MELVIEAIQEPSSVRRRLVAVRTLGQMVRMLCTRSCVLRLRLRLKKILHSSCLPVVCLGLRGTQVLEQGSCAAPE